MTRKELDRRIDEVLREVAAAHDMNTVPEPKGGDLGDVMALLGRVITKSKFDLVRATGGSVKIVSEGAELPATS